MHANAAHDTLLYLLADLAIIIVAARVMGAAARRLHQPAVIGEVLAGIIMGPTVLGHLSASLPADIFPSYVPLRSLADLGLVFFMFLVGLELDPTLLKRNGLKPAAISLSGVLLPASLGVGLGFAVFDVNLKGTFLEGTQPPERTAFALFMGAAMCITAFPILARILVETGLYRTAVGMITLCAAAIDDVIAWILLAAVVGLVQTGSPLEAARALGLTAVFVVLMLVAGRRLLAIVGRRYDASGHLTIDQVAIILAGVLVAAFVTEKIGIHSIFGAFIFGALMPKPSALTQELAERIEDFTVAVLLPVFFLVTGLRTDLFTLDDPALLGWLLAIVGVAVGGKLIGCSVAARLTGSSTRDSLVIGSLMNTRGLTELVILTIGLNLGVLSDRTFAMMVIMALSTTIMAAPIINRLMPRHVILAEIAAAERGLVPAAGRVLVALEGMLQAPAMVDLALRLVKDRRPAELLLVRLTPSSRAPELRSGLAREEGQDAAWQETMTRLAEQAAAAGVSARPLTFLSDDIAADLAALAREQSCDKLIAPPLTALNLETNARLVRRLLRLAHCEVVITGGDLSQSLQVGTRQVVALLSHGRNDEAAARTAVRLAATLQANLRLIGYAGEQTADDGAEASRRLALLADSLRSDSSATVTPEFHPEQARAVALTASETAGLLVAALDESRFEAESEAARLLFEARCPVLLVRDALPDEAVALVRHRADWPFITPSRERPEEPAPVVALPQPHLQKLDPWGEISETVALGDGVSIGRAAGNDVMLGDDLLVSRSHAEIRGRDKGYVLADKSTNGTMVWRGNRWLPVEGREEALEEGDLLVIGGNVFRFRATKAQAQEDTHGQVTAQH